MTDRPIIFNAPMVRAILDGRKVQTRRVIKPEWYRCLDLEDPGDKAQALKRCPYGQPGDRLYLKETWRIPERHCEGGLFGPIKEDDNGDLVEVHYRAGHDVELAAKVKWKSPRYMPKWASRIMLDIKNVRVERVRGISSADIRAEGVDCPEHDGPGIFCCSECPSLRAAFGSLWDSINGKKPGRSWADDPWVWPIGFERVTP